MDPEACQASRSWSIYTRPEITKKYEILERVGSGAYADVYRGRRRCDSLTVALKEVHDYQSAYREIEALQALQNSPNVVVLHEYFWREEEDAVLVLEFLQTDLAAVIRDAKRNRRGSIPVGEIKRWIFQILHGVDACHRNSIVHRDLKPSNLLISDQGVLKLADFGQARILMEDGFVADANDDQVASEQNNLSHENALQLAEAVHEKNKIHEYYGDQGPSMGLEDSSRDLDALRGKDLVDEIDKEVTMQDGNTSMQDGNTSCLATCTTSDREDDPFKGSCASEVEEGRDEGYGPLTSCVGTRWFRAPELLFGSTSYGPEIDLWSLGCIFAELFSLEPLFPGTSDIDQISRIFSVLGNLTEDVWPECVHLPDYKTISFGKIENPPGLEACLPGRSLDQIFIVKKLVCYDPASRATAMELLHDKFLNEEPLPVPIAELGIPNSSNGEDSPSEWNDYRGMDSDSDFEDFGPVNVTDTGTGFSIQFP